MALKGMNTRFEVVEHGDGNATVYLNPIMDNGEVIFATWAIGPLPLVSCHAMAKEWRERTARGEPI